MKISQHILRIKGAAVLLDAGLYKKLNKEILQDDTTYRLLDGDPTKDAKHIVTMLGGFTLKEHYIWITCDVVGLYPSITHLKGLQKLEEFISNYRSYSTPVKEFFVKAVHFLLTHNYFSFNTNFYLQRCGALMARFFPIVC